MKTLFIPAYSKTRIKDSEIRQFSKKLPLNLAMVYSVQYKQQAEQIKKILSAEHKITFLAQVLGCTAPKMPASAQAVLLLSDGKFHALSLAYETGLPIYIYNLCEFRRISEKEIETLKKHKKAAYLNFLNAKRIGILISTKPGQNRFQQAIALKNKLKKRYRDKQIYLFTADNINLNELQNFDISFWINTACPRIDFEFEGNKVINMGDLIKF